MNISSLYYRTRKLVIRFLLHITDGKESQRPILPLVELLVLIAAMVALMFYDPFRITAHVMDHLKAEHPLCIQEPRLLYLTSIYFGTFVFKMITLVFIFALVKTERIGVKEELALKKPDSKAWQAYIIPFVVLAAFLRTSYCADPLITNLPLRLVTPGAMSIGNIIIIFSVIFIAPITEELIFRGYMYDVLKRGFGAYISIAVTSLLFALAHLPQLGCEISGFFVIFAIGILLGSARYKTGSVLPPIIFHTIYNSVYIIIGVINFMILGY